MIPVILTRTFFMRAVTPRCLGGNPQVIPFAKPYFKDEWKRQILLRIEETLTSGQLTHGQHVQSVEEYFGKLLSPMHVSTTNSCTASLHLAMILAGIGKGDEVIVPSNTFAATANAVVYCGATPVFAEIDPHTLNIDPAAISEVVTKKTKAVTIVHLGGLPCDMRRIMPIIKKNKLVLVEDCAHAHGALYQGRQCGTFGEFSCFSFYPTKVIAGPEGGLLATSDLKADTKAHILINQGRGGFGPAEISEIGYNYRMNELQAIVVEAQMEHLQEIIRMRTELVARYRRNLTGHRSVTVPTVLANTQPSYYSFTVVLNQGNRDEIRSHLLNDQIETSIMYHPVHLQPIYRKMYGYKPGSLPTTEDICSRILSLPLHLSMSMDDVDAVCARLVSLLESTNT